ncbi:hypothetical protein [Clostridium sp. CF012]|nr:hypothetical protein [Clostridium sp. CF012]
MQFDKNIFTLFNRDDFTYRKGAEGIKKEYVEGDLFENQENSSK